MGSTPQRALNNLVRELGHTLLTEEQMEEIYNLTDDLRFRPAELKAERESKVNEIAELRAKVQELNERLEVQHQEKVRTAKRIAQLILKELDIENQDDADD